MALKGAIVSTVIAGGVLTGALVTWNGGGAIDTAKSLITQQQDSNAKLKQNEGKLIDKIGTLKGRITTLNAQVEDLKQQLADAVSGGTADEQEIAALKQQISDKNAQIASLNEQINDLNSQIASSDADGEKLAQRIKDLEGQLDEANKDAADLQNTVDTTVVQSSDDEAVAAALSDEGGTTTPTEPPTTETGDGGTDTDNPTNETPTASYDVNVKTVTGVPWVLQQAGYQQLTFDTSSNGDVTLTNTGGTSFTYTIDGTTKTLGAEAVATLGNQSALNNKIVTVQRAGYDAVDVLLTNN